MSIRTDAKEMVPHFEHVEGWNEERTKFRNLMRSIRSAEAALAGTPKKRRKKAQNDSSTGETAG